VVDGVQRILPADITAPSEHSSSLGRQSAATLRWFVAGPENRLAVYVAEEVLRQQRALSPLFVFGPVGVGKTHWAWALAARFSEQYPDAQVCALAANELTNGGIACAARNAEGMVDPDDRSGRLDCRQPFVALHDPPVAASQPSDSVRSVTDLAAGRRDLVRTTEIDLLVLDDVDELQYKFLAQQRLVHWLDRVEQTGGIALLTCHAPPGELRGLLPALRSRLSAGLLVKLAPPEQAARAVLAGDWAAQLGISLTPEAAELLARGSRMSPPEIRGALVSLACSSGAAARNSPLISASQVRAYFERQSSPGEVALVAVAGRTARYFGLTLAQLKSSSRERRVVEARAVAMYLARHLSRQSYEQIGVYFGRRDHTTVLHNCRRTEHLLAHDSGTRQAVDALQSSLSRQPGPNPSRRRDLARGKHVESASTSPGSRLA